MTVAVETPETTAIANGAVATFAVGFSCAHDTDLIVSTTDGDDDPVIKNLGVQYVLTGELTAGAGQVVFQPAFVPADGLVVTIARATPMEQPSVFGNLTQFLPRFTETALDRVFRVLQEIKLIAQRAAKGDQGDKGDPGGNVMAVGLFTALSGLTIPTGTDMIRTSGYAEAGKGAAFYVVGTAGDVQTATAWRKMSANNRPITLREPLPSAYQVGANGRAEADDTAPMQALIDYCEANLDFAPVAAPGSGDFLISHIEATTASLLGVKSHRTNNSPLNVSPVYGTRFIHLLGATDDLLTLHQGYGREYVRDIAFHGRKNQNRKTSVAITGASSRTAFTVAAGDAPAAPSDVTQAPYYGACVFFAGDFMLGTGVVETVNSGTGAITLRAGWDNYATRTGASNLLTTSDRVVFAPRGSWTGVLGETYTNVSDSTRAGYNGISAEGRNKVVERVYVSGFHCGIVGQEGVLTLDRIWTNNNGLAGVAQRKFGGAMSDCEWGHVFLQGYYGPDIDQDDNPLSLDNVAYQTTLAGLWGFPGVSNIHSVVADHAIIGFVDYGGSNITVGILFADCPLKVGFYSFQGISGLFDSALYVKSTQFRTFGQDPQVTPTPITYPGGERACITLSGANGRRFVTLGLSVTRWGPSSDTANDFSCITNITTAGTSPTPNDVEVGALGRHVGAVALWKGVRPFKGLAPFGTGGFDEPYVIATKRLVIGSDTADQIGLTNAVDKTARIQMANRSLTDPLVTLFHAEATATANLLNVGAGDSAAQSMTQIDLSTAATKTDTAAVRLRATKEGNIGIGTTAPLACAQLEVASTERGFLPPRMTETQRDAIPSQVNGLIIFNLTTGKLQVRESSAWANLT